MGYPEMSVCVCKRGKTTGILTVRVQLSLRGLGHPGELPGGGDPGLLVLPFQERRRGCQAAVVTSLELRPPFCLSWELAFGLWPRSGYSRHPLDPLREGSSGEMEEVEAGGRRVRRISRLFPLLYLPL